MESLYIGQELLTLTGEKVVIRNINETEIIVEYKHKTYSRPKKIVGVKLFIMLKDSPRRNDSDEISIEECDKPRTCEDCALFKREDCFGGTICQSFEITPRINKELCDSWPKYGDVTAIKYGGKHY